MKHEIGITVQLAKSRTENKFNMATNDGSGRVTEQIKLKGRCWFVGCGQGVSHVGLDQSPAGTHGLQDGERGWLAGKNEDVRVLPGGPLGRLRRQPAGACCTCPQLSPALPHLASSGEAAR